MTWEATGVVVTILVVFGSLMAFVFQSKWSCGQCQKNCRNELYHALDTLASKVNDRSELLTAVNAKLDMLILGLNIKVEAKKE